MFFQQRDEGLTSSQVTVRPHSPPNRIVWRRGSSQFRREITSAIIIVVWESGVPSAAEMWTLFITRAKSQLLMAYGCSETYLCWILAHMAADREQYRLNYSTVKAQYRLHSLIHSLNTVRHRVHNGNCTPKQSNCQQITKNKYNLLQLKCYCKRAVLNITSASNMIAFLINLIYKQNKLR